MGSHTNGMNCGVVEWVKRSTVRWFGLIERMRSEEFVKKVYVSESVGPNNRGRPNRRWKDRVNEYLHERAGLDQARRDRERWGLFCHGHSLGECFQREGSIRGIDRNRYIDR